MMNMFLQRLNSIRQYIYFLLFPLILFGQQVPASYSGIFYNDEGNLCFKDKDGRIIFAEKPTAKYRLQNMIGSPAGTETGIAFNFNDREFSGKLYYGFIAYGDSRHPMPVYYEKTAIIDSGRAHINITKMDDNHDMIGWEKNAKGALGYRVENSKGNLIYDGKISFLGRGPFKIDDTIIEGPFINILHPNGATISFKTNRAVKASVHIGKQVFSDDKPVATHEIAITGLEPATNYDYKVNYGSNSQKYSFRTANESGKREPFSFAYASDSRSGQGGGERDLYGANFYIMKKIMALATLKKIRFMQFTGDMINGYLRNIDEMNLQYANWKRSVEPFAHYFPIVAAMGNHEAFMHVFRKTPKIRYEVDRFPFATQSGEAVYAANFVNPLNGPISEDGSKYDPNVQTVDFPSYKENVFYYVYDNVAVIVLNSDYWYAPSLKYHTHPSGNLHGYIMDNQLEWFRETLVELEENKSVDHVFVTQHTPFFPNGGHVKDDMWYHGDNSKRAVVAGKPVEKGIIERRDELLDAILNKSSKVVAILTGDEHNYNKLRLTEDTNIYPENYPHDKVEITRDIWQINNGAAGAPYYAQEKTPWSPFVSGFTTQNALVIFYVHGKNLRVEVINPDTLETIETFVIKE